MSETPLATGGMSSGGAITPIKISEPQLDPADKKVLCSSICHCKDTPGTGKDGRSLKQMCVSGALKAKDTAMNHQSPYKPEVNYDMTQTPPAPIMDSKVETKGHSWLPGWIEKYWGSKPEHSDSYKAGKGLVRRPDVVIVNDPGKPPTQDNIKQVVEIKFPPDGWSKMQKDRYTVISGNADKLVKLEPDDCDCNKPEPEPTKIPVKELGATATLAGAAAMLLRALPVIILAP